MGVVASQLVGEVSISGVESSVAGLLRTAVASDSVGASFKALALGGVAIAGGALLAIGAKAVQMAGTFQAGMTSLVTGAGESAKNIKMVSDGILKMAVDTGSSTKELTDGMYMIESASYHGAAGLAVLQAASEGAKVGNAQLADVANGVTTAMTDYAKTGLTAAQATNDLIATVAAGKTHMQDLATSMSTILPTAAAVGVSFGDVSGAMATMTGEGTDAASAATYLRQLLMALENPAHKGAAALKSFGLYAGDVSAEMEKSRPATLQMITDALKKKFPEGSAAYVAALAAMSGGSKQMQGMLELTGDHLNVFKGNVLGIADAVKQGGKSITGWSDVTQDFNFKMDKAKEVIETLGIKLGTVLLPIIGKIVDFVSTHAGPAFEKLGAIAGKVGDFLTKTFAKPLEDLKRAIEPIVKSIGDWAAKNNAFGNSAEAVKSALQGIATAVAGMISNLAKVIKFFEDGSLPAQAIAAALVGIGVAIATMQVAAFVAAIPAIVAGLVVWAAAAWTAAAGMIAATWPVLAIGAAIAIVVAGIILAVQHWGDITKWLGGIWSAFSSWFMGMLSATGNFFKSLWDGVINWFKSVWNGAVAVVSAVVTWLGNVWQDAVNTVVGWFVWLYNHNYYFKDLVDAIVGFFTGVFSWLKDKWNEFSGWISGVWKGISSKASEIWGNVSTTVKDKSGQATNWLHDNWNKASDATNSFFTTIGKATVNAWNYISNVFSQVWTTYISPPLTSLWNNVSTWFTGLVSQAQQWGVNLIKGFTNGITSMMGSVGNAVSGVADKVKSLMGFHSPTKEGPASDSDRWAPAFVNMFASGLEAGIPKIENIVGRLAKPIAVNLAPASSSFASGSSGFLPSMQTTSATPNITVMPAPVYLDGRQITSGLMPHFVGAIRATTGARI